jgi:hypothetical protein
MQSITSASVVLSALGGVSASAGNKPLRRQGISDAKAFFECVQNHSG